MHAASRTSVFETPVPSAAHFVDEVILGVLDELAEGN
ncbi:hypothetical protein SAMN04489841_1653 [Natrinema salaciae]|uniref:Uncharacterized protein n=1 Tax=Natrinema salaciae TaxID=1186196 RepID=A0A1H9FR17_9EURY|nr:hypothetical protein SAMN04489841_1653 [Natrinema salaciae]